jgi:hypothetical protein
MEEFMNGAPDAAAHPDPRLEATGRAGTAANGKPRKNPKPAADETVQIALKLTQGDLDRIDEAAAAQRISRAGFIRQAVFKSIDGAG